MSTLSEASGTTIGLIAGEGMFPLRFAASARRAGHRVVAVALEGEADPSIEAHCDEVSWLHVGKLGAMVEFLRSAGATKAAMAGAVAKVQLFGGLRPDLAALKLATKLPSFETDKILRAVAAVFEEEGIPIVDPLAYCPDLVAREGIYGRRKPDKAVWQDIEFGLRIAASLHRSEVGQTVCVKKGNVVAVEAMEGTDRCILRAGEIAGKGVVVVKTPTAGQDMRLDAPTVGPTTIESCVRIGAACLAIAVGKTVVLDEATMVERADKAKLAVVGVHPRDQGGASWTKG